MQRLGGAAHLDGPHDLKLCRRAEVHPLSKDQDEAMTKTIVILHLFPEEEPEISGDVPAGHVHPHDAVGHREALVDGHRVRHPVTGVQHYASGAACRGVSCFFFLFSFSLISFSLSLLLLVFLLLFYLLLVHLLLVHLLLVLLLLPLFPVLLPPVLLLRFSPVA